MDLDLSEERFRLRDPWRVALFDQDAQAADSPFTPLDLNRKSQRDDDACDALAGDGEVYDKFTIPHRDLRVGRVYRGLTHLRCKSPKRKGAGAAEYGCALEVTG